MFVERFAMEVYDVPPCQAGKSSCFQQKSLKPFSNRMKIPHGR
jgi:hypothetical protein